MFSQGCRVSRSSIWLDGVPKPDCTLNCPDPSDVPFGFIYIMTLGNQLNWGQHTTDTNRHSLLGATVCTLFARCSHFVHTLFALCTPFVSKKLSLGALEAWGIHEGCWFLAHVWTQSEDNMRRPHSENKLRLQFIVLQSWSGPIDFKIVFLRRIIGCVLKATLVMSGMLVLSDQIARSSMNLLVTRNAWHSHILNSIVDPV